MRSLYIDNMMEVIHANLRITPSESDKLRELIIDYARRRPGSMGSYFETVKHKSASGETLEEIKAFLQE